MIIKVFSRLTVTINNIIGTKFISNFFCNRLKFFVRTCYFNKFISEIIHFLNKLLTSFFILFTIKIYFSKMRG